MSKIVKLFKSVLIDKKNISEVVYLRSKNFCDLISRVLSNPALGVIKESNTRKRGCLTHIKPVGDVGRYAY